MHYNKGNISHCWKLPNMCIMQITKNQKLLLPSLKKKKMIGIKRVLWKMYTWSLCDKIILDCLFTAIWMYLEARLECHVRFNVCLQHSNDPRNLAVKFLFHYLKAKNCSLVHCGSAVKTKFNVYGLMNCQMHVCCNLIHANSWVTWTYRAFICDVLLIWISFVGPCKVLK